MRWELNINRKIDLGSSSEQMIQSMNMGSISEVEKIEDEYPGYLHYLYREAIKVISSKAGFKEIATFMNEKSDIPTEVRPTLALSRRQVNDWFVTNNGKEFSPFEKPLDMQKHCEERKAWVVKY